MISETIFIFNTSLSIFSFFLILLCFFFISYKWKAIFIRYSWLKPYKNKQRVHENEVPRIGGILIFLGCILFCLSLYNPNIIIQNILLSVLPIFFISIKEDLFHNTLPMSRLFAMVLSSLIFFSSVSINFPTIEFPGINFLFNSYWLFEYVFFVMCLIILMNGNNFIDGSNGLMGISSITQLCSLIFLSIFYNDNEILVSCFCILLPLIIFFIFNYPFGKVFCGDFGAYFLGFSIGIITIIFFGRHQYISSWLGFLILFYPVFEVFFSILRKFLLKQHPMEPDLKHLHHLVFVMNRSFFKGMRISNSFVLVVLFPIWLSPAILVYLYHSSFINILFSLIFCFFLYLIFYLYFKKTTNLYVY